jgi:hypothetical protein
MAKQLYTAPRLTAHGRIADLTRQGTMANSDMYMGNANTAWPAHS